MNPRAFVDNPIAIGQDVTIAGEDGHHFSRVLRLRPGEPLCVASSGQGYMGSIIDVDQAAATVTVRIDSATLSHEPVVQVFLAQALPKGDKLEEILKHGTEVGFAGYLLFSSARSVVRLEMKKLSGRLERWNKIVREASSQAQRDVIPSVDFAPDARSLEEWMERISPDCILFLDEEERQSSLESIYAELASPQRIVLCVGPEGGWDDAERTSWLKMRHSRATTLGPRILRTETAGLVAGAATMYHYGAMGGL